MFYSTPKDPATFWRLCEQIFNHLTAELDQMYPGWNGVELPTVQAMLGRAEAAFDLKTPKRMFFYRGKSGVAANFFFRRFLWIHGPTQTIITQDQRGERGLNHTCQCRPSTAVAIARVADV
jgi:hypothetical protein